MKREKEPLRLLFTGGGTGGHLFPAIATAEAFCQMFPETRILFVGTRRKMDQSCLARAGFTVRSIHCQGVKGKNALALLQALALLPLSLVEALWQVARFRPRLVVGVGGFVTGPVVLAARILGVPTVIHEQNSVPGLANRKLGKLATRVCLSLPASQRYFPAATTVVTGNPVRARILELAARPVPQKGDGPTLLILGGSLGAHRVNELVVGAVTGPEARLPAGLKIIHQTGAADEEWVRSAYQKSGIKATVAAFFTDMAEVYGQSDLLISRAGATTLAELAVLGKPALLIPYPYAADNHQESNARYYADHGGAVVLVERELSSEKLAAALAELITQPVRLQEMAAAMRERGCPQATTRIVEVCLSLMETTQGG